ncbi:MAG: GTPase Era [Gemmatimonadales bacterium]|nr:GTPase Era [Gemmatimonadales bacterium]
MTRFGRVALAGRPNVGKSSLMNALVGEPLSMVSPKAQATRLPVVGIRTEGESQIVFHDLPGLLDPSYLLQSRMVGLALRDLARSDLVLHLHPASDAPAPPLASLLPPDAKLPRKQLTVYTKADLAPDSLEAADDRIFVSAAQGTGLAQLIDRITALLPEGEWEYPADDLGAQPLRFFVVEYLREAAFQYLEDELPYAFTADVDEFQENRDPVYIRATLYVERDSQKRILIGTQGRTIKAIGQHARQRLEGLLGSRVYLETWVKVLPRWRQSADLLTRLGFPDLNERRDAR